MPNHITNRLTIQATDNQVIEVKDFLRGEPYDDGNERAIDFSKIVPMPESLNISSDSWLMPIENKFDSGASLAGHLQKFKAHLEKYPDLKEDGIKNFTTGIENYLKYGHATWYTWAVANWGTKWNAYGQRKREGQPNNVLYFETAWSGVTALIQKLAEQFPDVTFLYDYADEDTGNNVGSIRFVGAQRWSQEIDNSSNEAYELAFELNPEQQENYRIVDGRYQYYDKDEEVEA